MEFICPHCKNPIHDDEALLCHYCGESLGRTSSGALGKVKGSGQKRIYFIFFALLALAAFVVLMIRW